MTALKDHLISLIRLHGPMTVSAYMTEALTNPQHGYYAKQTPFGTKGDFITAPEISQMFGELIGLWFADLWLKMGSPSKVHLIELGPGRGTLMSDLLRSVNALPDFLNKIDLHFVEASSALKEQQKQKLSAYPNNKYWHDSVKNALDQTAKDDGFAATFIIGNEFLDALPIRQFQKSDLGWHERMINTDESGEGLSYSLSPFPVQDVKLPSDYDDAEMYSVIETCPMGEFITYEISKYFKKHRGAALFIDYGYDKYQTGETLQAVEDHKFTGIFDNPGHADLSAHVNFIKTCDIAREVGIYAAGPTTQGAFLKNMGIDQRAATLLSAASDQQANDIKSGLHRLTSPEEMGELFKVCALSSEKYEMAGF
ncbi:class I SAM-dependent methyltransferase [Pseudemcibacter aquimaris]|uniref:class I SAM-dependent methyltransferase n=1 Tax=Pseudemcibacter aquimaris TaxID=2857064 RepID=UPI002011C893|nr:SAM-dependent methyltransferase [Pseudemcibacter aquimaris]MCC3861004.1 SAM-dependent methyltransferase [Pseudemcibacter aquimaris]WDU59822.1 SAM-dependent methyltransferase [Pseudemcibacter aquimaris]